MHSKPIINLACRVVFDKEVNLSWEKRVFEASYLEYRMQHQTYNYNIPDTTTYEKLVLHNTNALQIPFIIGVSIQNLIEELKGQIPGLKDNLGNSGMAFINYRVDIVDADLHDKSSFKIGITFYSPPMLLLEVIDKSVLVSVTPSQSGTLETLMFELRPQLTISHYKI